MKAKSILVVGLLILVALGGLMLLGDRPSNAADPVKGASPEIGRYHLIMGQDGKPGYLFDTTMGRVMQPYFPNNGKIGEWNDYILMPKAK
jgi:hypothetical protein